MSPLTLERATYIYIIYYISALYVCVVCSLLRVSLFTMSKYFSFVYYTGMVFSRLTSTMHGGSLTSREREHSCPFHNNTIGHSITSIVLISVWDSGRYRPHVPNKIKCLLQSKFVMHSFKVMTRLKYCNVTNTRCNYNFIITRDGF